VKIGSKDYALSMNNSPDVIDSINAFPVAQVGGNTVFMRDIAHVHDGFQVQTNSVTVDGTPGALITIRKTGGVSTLAVIDGVRAALTNIRKVMPNGVSIKPIFDQSIFVNAALSSVKMGGLMAAGLTALMILLFLGNWRLTLIILAAIPLSIIAAVLVMYVGGQTLNTMTLGGFALAVGILVDNGTVVIENIERHVGLGEPLEEAIVGARARSPSRPSWQRCASVSFSCRCSCCRAPPNTCSRRLSLSVCVSLLASLVLSFTMVPVLFMYLMRSQVAVDHSTEPSCHAGQAP
jgi:multidrug efflux pump subunit AcrB